jgi:hypothetical protein
LYDSEQVGVYIYIMGKNAYFAVKIMTYQIYYMIPLKVIFLIKSVKVLYFELTFYFLP